MYVIWFMIGCLTTFNVMGYVALRCFEKHDRKECKNE